MKRSWLIAVMAAMMSVPSIYAADAKMAAKPAAKQAQAGDDDEHENKGVDRRLERLTSDLSLSKSQQADLRKILEESRDKQRAVRKEMNEKRRAIKEETDKKIAAVLKPDQKKKFESMMDGRGGRGAKDAQGR